MKTNQDPKIQDMAERHARQHAEKWDAEREQQGTIYRDYEPEQAYGTAHDFQEHTRFGGTREDY